MFTDSTLQFYAFSSNRMKLYCSMRTNLRVAILDDRDPGVRATISFATHVHEADSGVPHALEHMIFKGSRTYPYDIRPIARNLFSDHNANSDELITSFSINSITSEYFLLLLPIFMDSILSPALTEDDFLREVYNANDGTGVVYCETLDKELGYQCEALKLLKEAIYPEESPYRGSTNGSLSDIRRCTIVKVRKFHKDFYNLNNMLIVVSGDVNCDELMQNISLLESIYMWNTPLNIIRPPVQFLQSLDCKLRKINCASEYENFKFLQINWLGPTANDIWTTLAVKILIFYITLNISKPKFTTLTVENYKLQITFLFITYERSISEIEQLHDWIVHEKIPTFYYENSFKMNMMTDLIKQLIDEYTESMGTEIYFSRIKEILLNGLVHQLTIQDTLLQLIHYIPMLEIMMQQNASFWANLARQYLSNNNISFLFLPSNRIEDYDSYEIIKNSPIVVGSIQQRRSKATQQSYSLFQTLYSDFSLYASKLDIFNFKKQFVTSEENNIFEFNIYETNETNNVQVFYVFDTINMPISSRKFLFIYFDIIFDSIDINRIFPIVKFGQNLISYSIKFIPECSRYILLNFRSKKEDLEKLFVWSLLFFKENRVFNFDKVRLSAQKMLDKAVLEGNLMEESIYSLIPEDFREKSTNDYLSLMTLFSHHLKILEACNSQESWVLDSLFDLDDYILDAPFSIHFSSPPNIITEDIAKVYDFHSSASEDESENEESPPFVLPKNLKITVLCDKTFSSYALIKIPFNHRFCAKTFANMNLFCSYLLRFINTSFNDNGLVYCANMTLARPMQICFEILFSINIFRAYENFIQTINAVLAERLDEEIFEEVKRNLIFTLTQSIYGVNTEIVERITNTICGFPLDWKKQVFLYVCNSTVDEVSQHTRRMFKKMFNEDSSRTILVPEFLFHGSTPNEVVLPLERLQI